MKIFVTVLAFIASYPFSGLAQDTTYIYYTSKWEVVNATDNYNFFNRIVYSEKETLYYLSQYDSAGVLLKTEQYLDKKREKKTGDFIFYYSSGQKKKMTSYENNKRTGLITYWYENGQIKEQADEKDENCLVINAWDSLGNMMVSEGSGYYKEYFNDTAVLCKEGSYVNGKMNGGWKYYSKDGSLRNSETWADGELIKGTAYTSDGERAYIHREEQASFPGGMTALYKYIQTSLSYPSNAREKRIQGKVYVEFIVWKDGSIRDVSIKKGVHPDLDAEAVKIIEAMPPWEPGLQRGFPINSRFVLTINFSLSSGNK